MEYDDLELDDYKNILTFYNIKILDDPQPTQVVTIV